LNLNNHLKFAQLTRHFLSTGFWTPKYTNSPLTHPHLSDNFYIRMDSNNNTPKKKPSLDLTNLPDLLTVSEVAHLLRVSPLTIKRWGKRGKLPAIRINSRGDRRYRKEQVLWLLGINPESPKSN